MLYNKFELNYTIFCKSIGGAPRNFWGSKTRRASE